MNQVLSTIAARRSHRAYQPQQLTPAQLDALLAAALQSPSAMNRQPWHFSVVQNNALLEEINDAVRENAMKRAEDQRSPRFADPAFNVFYHAPTVIFLSADQQNRWNAIDCGIAVENLALAAESMGLGSVVLGLPREAFQGEKAPRLRQELHFPEGYDFMIALAVGVPADEKPAHPVGENKITIIG